MTEKILVHKNLVVRHSGLELMEHWAIAISGLVLLFTGIFELPVAKRYYIITLPGLGWSADFITSLYLHYAAALVFLSRGNIPPGLSRTAWRKRVASAKRRRRGFNYCYKKFYRPRQGAAHAQIPA